MSLADHEGNVVPETPTHQSADGEEGREFRRDLPLSALLNFGLIAGCVSDPPCPPTYI